MKKIIVIGGGAAGMFAAIWAADGRNEVHIYEKNEKLGKKLFITGKGRCNVTTACETMQDLMDHVVSNPRFLYSAFSMFDNHDMVRFLEQAGLPLKTERGLRIFPQSDKSSDVIRTLTQELKKRNVKIHLEAPVSSLLIRDGTVEGIRLSDNSVAEADAVIVATGGISYASTGSTGDGYVMAREAGHKLIAPKPSLVPMITEETWCAKLQGLSLRNVGFCMRSGKKKICEDTGEMMFTHFGITGPLVLSASAYAGKYLEKGPLTVTIDMKPALSQEKLDQRILRDFDKYQNRQIRNALGDLLPASLIPVVLENAKINQYKAVHDITREERRRLADQVKSMTLTITGLRGLSEAIITQGGVSVREIVPDTMESKLVRHLYFAGEVMDIDAVTGGFNLQIAWSTGYAAGKGAAARMEGE